MFACIIRNLQIILGNIQGLYGIPYTVRRVILDTDRMVCSERCEEKDK